MEALKRFQYVFNPLICELLWKIQFQYVIQFIRRDIPIVIPVNLFNRPHYCRQFLIPLFVSGYLAKHLSQLFHGETLQQSIVNRVLSVEDADVADGVIHGFLLVGVRDGRALVDSVQALLVVDVVDLRNVDPHLLSLVAARENVLQEPAVVLRKLQVEGFLKDVLETVEKDLSVFIFLLCLMFNRHNQLPPFLLP